MPKAKQVQTTLVSVLASSQKGAQQTIDAFSRHTASPGAVQDLTELVPGKPQLLLAQASQGLVKTVSPQDETLLLFQQREGAAVEVRFNLPQQTRQGGDSFGSILMLQGLQSLAQNGLITKVLSDYPCDPQDIVVSHGENQARSA